MEQFLYPNRPVRCIITGPSECRKSVFLKTLTFYFINDLNKIYIYSPSLHQNLYENLFKCFSNYIPNYIIPRILNVENIDIVIDEIVDKKKLSKI